MKLEDIRREYLKGGLSAEQLVENPIDQFNHWLDQAIKAEMTSDPTAMTLATVNASGQPSSRIVLLKHVDQEGFVFYTNYGSQKAHDISENNQVCLSFAWLPLERQIIIRGKAKKLSLAKSTAYFLSRPRESQLAAWASHQSSKVSSRKMLEQAFGQIKQRFKEGEVPLPSFWGGYLIEPESIEFWQGGGKRLHDRMIYQKDGEQWQISRLQP